MPYTPPLGNAVVFNFTTGTYTPPFGSSVLFNFGGTPPPPSSQVGAKLRQLSFFDEDWFTPPPRRFIPITGYVSNVLPFRRILPKTDYEDDWLWHSRPIYNVPNPRRKIRISLFTVT